MNRNRAGVEDDAVMLEELSEPGMERPGEDFLVKGKKARAATQDVREARAILAVCAMCVLTVFAVWACVSIRNRHVTDIVTIRSIFPSYYPKDFLDRVGKPGPDGLYLNSPLVSKETLEARRAEIDAMPIVNRGAYNPETFVPPSKSKEWQDFLKNMGPPLKPLAHVIRHTNPDEPFSYVEYIAMRTMVFWTHPTKIIFYVQQRPTGKYFDALLTALAASDINIPVEYNICADPIMARLDGLYDLGGFTWDTHSFQIKPLGILLASAFDAQVSYGYQVTPGRIWILARPKAEYVKAYTNFIRNLAPEMKAKYIHLYAEVGRRVVREAMNTTLVLPREAFFADTSADASRIVKNDNTFNWGISYGFSFAQMPQHHSLISSCRLYYRKPNINIYTALAPVVEYLNSRKELFIDGEVCIAH